MSGLGGWVSECMKKGGLEGEKEGGREGGRQGVR